MADRTVLHVGYELFLCQCGDVTSSADAACADGSGGDRQARHGIVLTANYLAKRQGVKTGMALWQARQVCPAIQFVPPRMDLYLRFSRMAHEIYREYTDLWEPYGCDEVWMDVRKLFPYGRWAYDCSGYQSQN